MRKNKTNRRITPAKPQRIVALDWRKPLIAAGSLVITGALLFATLILLDRPIESVTVNGQFQRVTTLQVEAAVADHLTGGFVTVDIHLLREGITSMPWVDRVRVQRRWPNQLSVQVTEQIAAARWGDSGLLNTRGELFIGNARHTPPELPRLEGPAGSEAKVARQYLRMNDTLADAGFVLRALSLDARGAWRLTLANGIEVRLGRRNVDTRMERFVTMVSDVIQTRLDDVAYVDMRYSNGFAVGWQAASDPGSYLTEESQPNV